MLYHGDCLDVMAEMDENSIDSIVTDPPYGLKFMGKEWDHGVPGVKYWKEFLRVAKPGAALLAFGGTRTHHRLMCAIEDAGWEIRDCLMWVYGSGFPKSHDISKAIDKAAIVPCDTCHATGKKQNPNPTGWEDFWLDEPCPVCGGKGTVKGAEREVVGERQAPRRPGTAEKDKWRYGDSVIQVTAPATDAAQLWDGWGTALKPAYEPIILAMKPRDGTFAENALEWGVAGIWVDGCRVATNGETLSDNSNTGQASGGVAPMRASGRIAYSAPAGRWPANLILSHTPECRQECAPGCPVAMLDEQSGERNGSHPQTPTHSSNAAFGGGRYDNSSCYADTGGASRFFYCAPGCPVAMLDAQSGERRSSCGGGHSTGERGSTHSFGYGGAPLGYDGSDGQYYDTGGASRFFYCAKASRSERTCDGEVENTHPTVKPLDVMRWLVRLTATPTGGVVYDPFMGSGTTGMAAVMEGREFIGSELERESFEIAEARIAWAERQAPDAVQLEMTL